MSARDFKTVNVFAFDENNAPLEGVIMQVYSDTYKHRDVISGSDGKLSKGFVKSDQNIYFIYGDRQQTFTYENVPESRLITKPSPLGYGVQIIGIEPARIIFNRKSNVTVETATQDAHLDTWSEAILQQTGWTGSSQEHNLSLSLANGGTNSINSSSSKSTSLIFGAITVIGAISMYLIKMKKK